MTTANLKIVCATEEEIKRYGVPIEQVIKDKEMLINHYKLKARDLENENDELKRIMYRLVNALRARVQPNDGLQAFVGAMCGCMTVDQMRKYGYGYLLQFLED